MTTVHRTGTAPAAVTVPARTAARAPRTGAILTIILLGQFMALLDVSVVNVAAPTIRADLHASGAGLQLVVAGYTIVYAMLLITGARLGDRLGHRQVFLGGMVLFTVASLACGLAPSTGMLVGFRMVQGAGAALMVPQVLSLIQRHFPPRERARALGRYAAVIASGAVVGQVVGGALVGADLAGTGWRPVFLVNVPIGVAVLAAGWRILPRDAGEPDRRLDLPGLVTLSAAVLLFVVPLVLGREEHWPVWGWVCLAASAALLPIFALVQRRASAPLVPGRVLRAPGMLPALGAIFVAMAVYGGYLLSVALHLQSGLGYSPLHAGLTFVPVGLCFGFASLNWRRVPARLHRRMIPTGLLLGGVSLALLSVSVRDGSGPDALFWVSQVLFGLGFGCAFSPMITLALAGVPAADAADASGLLTTMTQLAQVVGVATFATLYLSLVGRDPSGHAMALTAAATAAATVLAAASAFLLPRPAPRRG
jgi:EmrB/QacA subfamily drug resistance transporter